MAKRKRASRQPDFLAALIHTAYMPAEIPPAVTPKYFSDYCRAHFKELKLKQDRLIARTSNYDTFTAPRSATGRRALALVHPLAQLGLSLLITQHRSRIKTAIAESKTSLYRIHEVPSASRAFAGLDFDAWHSACIRLYSDHPIILKADISRFFYTAYTHSLPWAIVGKAKVKSWLAHDRKRLNKHWSHALDSALQSCQARETFGFPVGPDTSRVVAEILLAGVEADRAFATSISGRSAVRLLDDFIVGFDDERSAHSALASLRSALWKFNLQLNDEKTMIAHSQSLFEERWKLEFRAIGIASSSASRQKRDIHRLVDLTLGYCAEWNTGMPANWACHRLSKIRRWPENSEIVVDALLRLARAFPSCIRIVSVFLVNNQAICADTQIRRKVELWVKTTVRANINHAHDFEVTWCLLVAGVLKITLGEHDVGSVDNQPGFVTFAMLGMLRERGLLTVSLERWRWRSRFRKSGAYSECWLPFYESVRRGWTKDKGIVSAIRADPIFSKMLANKVTFLEDQVFDAANISLSRRSFKTRGPKKAIKSLPLRLNVKGPLGQTTAFDFDDYDF